MPPRPQTAQESGLIRQVPRQTTHRDRDHARQTERLATGGDTVRQLFQSLTVRKRSRRIGHLLAEGPKPKSRRILTNLSFYVDVSTVTLMSNSRELIGFEG